MSTDEADRIVTNMTFFGPDRGWRRNRGIDLDNHLLVRLKRVSDTAEEGVFTCRFGDDMFNSIGYLGIYYPSQ